MSAPTPPRTIIVCGGRDYADRERLFRCLDLGHAARPIGVLVHGNAAGADRLAGEWALARGVHAAAVPALWDAHGRAAGPLRNAAMLLLRPEVVIAFPGNAGTRDMVARARAAGVRVVEVGRG